MTDPVVVDRPGRSRFEILVDDEVAGRAHYRLHDGVMVFTHTEVEDRFGGRGLGGALARGALDAARARGLRVSPDCPFVKSWIEKHPEYADLL
ncbi:GNAT family N-acetyltransferase [Pseudonocardia sp. N23]|uniref:GNAT family N-acetyltransferase n=1 Tax=Pseudonocardia sp. N23 TaxID=1987376 RepID=UPI000BFBC886|nr:GNAT family N-acetyltransferase [Pseudonocardia sp. N23]GAY11605.1 hypothetical protein TOK_6115 [Pseudonocardia sp. N23]